MEIRNLAQNDLYDSKDDYEDVVLCVTTYTSMVIMETVRSFDCPDHDGRQRFAYRYIHIYIYILRFCTEGWG